jgi:uncharacterized membrane protein
MNHTKTGAFVATAAAALFAFGATLATPTFADTDGVIKCAGINSCKGTSECKTAQNECKGQNSCKGQGWVGGKTALECKQLGGKVL